MTYDDDHDQALELDALPGLFGDDWPGTNHWLGYTAKVGMRKPDLREWFNDTPIQRASRVLDQMRRESVQTREPATMPLDGCWVCYDWAEPCDDCKQRDGLTFTEQEADRNAALGRDQWGIDLTEQEAADFIQTIAEMRPRTLGTLPRPCCHTTGPLHHPACQEGS